VDDDSTYAINTEITNTNSAQSARVVTASKMRLRNKKP
jgi:hypothetical protein